MASRRRQVVAVLLVLGVAVGSFVGGYYLGSRGSSSASDATEHDFFTGIPGTWRRGCAFVPGDYQQCFGYGNFTGSPHHQMLGSWSHSHPGLFLHTRGADGTWAFTLADPRFDPNNTRRGMDSAWRVKGFDSGDYDGDGLVEVISFSDAVHFPLAHGNTTFSFPGGIYMDYNLSAGAWVMNPLFWGSWGEALASATCSNQFVFPVNASFRQHGLLTSQYPPVPTDFLVATLQANPDNRTSCGRLYVLEQPDATFAAVDYRYATPAGPQADPLAPVEPFYLHHLHVNHSGVIAELGWNASDHAGAVSGHVLGTPVDFNGDGLVDLVATGSYYDAEGNVIWGRVRAYQRVPSAAPHEYLFTVAFDYEARGTRFGHPQVADLDGPGGTHVGLVFPVAGYSRNYNYRTNGIATLEYTGTTWTLAWTRPEDLALVYEYFGFYSNPVVADFNGDGYDDVALKLDRTIEEYAGFGFGLITVGDLVVFYNRGPESRPYPDHFAMNRSHVEVLWAKDAFTWWFKLRDADGDGQVELVTAISRPVPAWDAQGTTPRYAVYYRELDTIGLSS